MQLHTEYVTTEKITNTYRILEDHLPSILCSDCYNKSNLPFKYEVKKTEIGHLFEHILLEHLSLVTFNKTNTSKKYSGMTSWNWKNEKRGIFHIQIDIALTEKDLFINALKKSIQLLEKILIQNSILSN